MRMHRFFLKNINRESKKITFPSDISHQIKHVLRLGKGGRVIVLDGNGNAFEVKLSQSMNGDLSGEVVEVLEEKTQSNVNLHEFFPLSKREKTEWILQKGTEVGVDEFHPFISNRSIVQKVEFNDKRKKRWETIIREAAEQSERRNLPILCDPESFQEVIKTAADTLDLVIAAVVGERNRNLKQVLEEKKKILHAEKDVLSIGLFIGPEGGFSHNEVELMMQSGAEIISLGENILRLETAAIVFPALVMHEISEQLSSE